MKSIVRYFKGVGRETKRIKWPTRETFIPALIVVVIITIFAGLFLALEDYGANILLEQLRNAFQSMR